MLFDLRGRGRRRTVQVIYLSLALLMGGGLVFFGIGGDVQGGLFDAFSQNQGSENDALEEQVEAAEKRVQANRQDANAWAELARAKFNLAGQTEGYDETTGAFSGEARAVVQDAVRAWEQHLKLADEKPNAEVAGTLTRAFIALDRPEEAVRTQEIVIDSLPNPGFGDYAALAEYAYVAGQTRKGDLAAQRALEDAEEEGVPKERRDEIKTRLDSIKQQAAQAAAQEATQGAGAAPPATP
jgi:tetratricopeptide (TPR) repeat protein